ncbi:MAG: hypothetical protein R2942_07670 [Ignavibacteria bacterium]
MKDILHSSKSMEISTVIFSCSTEKQISLSILQSTISLSEVSNSSCAFDKNNKGIYFISDEGREFKGIKYYNIAKKTSTWIIKEKWDVTGFKLSEDHTQLLWTINKNGSSTPKIMDLKTGKSRKSETPERSLH